jgi:hypothetical protein
MNAVNGERDRLNLAVVQARFLGWLCWPGRAGTCFAVHLRPWIEAGELNLITASSPADLHDLLTALTGTPPIRCADQRTPALAKTTPKPHRRRCRTSTRPVTGSPPARRRRPC